MSASRKSLSLVSRRVSLLFCRALLSSCLSARLGVLCVMLATSSRSSSLLLHVGFSKLVFSAWLMSSS